MPESAARRRTRFIDAAIEEYSAAHSTGPDVHQSTLQATTREKTGRAAGMQIGDDQAVVMEMIVRAMGAKSAVEVGTFTGYSALAIARGLGPEGRLLCCDVSEEWTSIARDAWEEAGVEGRIELRYWPWTRDTPCFGARRAIRLRLYRRRQGELSQVLRRDLAAVA